MGEVGSREKLSLGSELLDDICILIGMRKERAMMIIKGDK